MPYSYSKTLLSSFVMDNYSSDTLTIIVEPSSGILRATWARPLLTAGLIDSYQYLLEQAENHGCCRFWHLDLRMSIWPAATFGQWLTDTFAPWATQRLRGPVFVACWVAAKHRPDVEHALTVAMQHRVAKVGFYPRFFDKEPAARAWLLDQQAHDPAGKRQARQVEAGKVDRKRPGA